MNTLKYIICTLFFFELVAFQAQEKLGISNSNYSSTNSIYLNPSSSVDSKTYMQLNLAGVNAFFFNNVAYLPWFSVWRLRRAGGEVQYPKISSIPFKKFFYANAGIDGPAFVISKRNYGAGIFARARTVVDARGIPYELTNLLLNNNPYDNFPKEDNINLRNVKFSTMSWVEYGLNFGMMYKRIQKNLWTVGGNLKYMTGINIFYGNLSRIKGFYNDTTVKVDEMSGKLRYNLPAFNSGRGFGMDLGVTYKKMLKNVDSYYAHSEQSNCTVIDYKFKAALSLRDAGYIRFTKGTAKANISASGEYKASLDTTQEGVASSLNLTLSNDKILATLPTNLSAQIDWNFGYHFYINGTIVKNLVPHQLTGVSSPNLLSVCPRYEFRQFELAMPFTLQKFVYPQVGFAFRVRTFVLGFDNIFPLLFMKPKTYGLGAYFNLGISLFKNPACRTGSQRAVDCPPNILTKDRNGKRRWWKFWKKSK